jgi:hypothetical protein
MPIRSLLLHRRSRRLCALLTTCAALSASALAPSPASAYEEHFCQWVALGSGWECFAGNRHTLQQVNAWSMNSFQRICASSFSTPWGSQNSDWRCDYGVTSKWLGGRVVGVGAIHNGDPYWLHTYGVQYF